MGGLVAKITSAAPVQDEVEVAPVRRTNAERFRLQVDVGVIGEAFQSRGSVRDMSVTGARIEGVAERPPEGAQLRLGFSFHSQSLPVPIHATVVRHTESGGFAVAFEDMDFRTQILLRALLPNVSGRGGSEIQVSPGGKIEAELSPALHGACEKLAEASGLELAEWVVEQLERAALQGLLEE